MNRSEQAKEMRSQGKSLAEIAGLFHVSISSIKSWLKWQPKIASLSERRLKHKRAVELYIEGVPLKAICEQVGITSPNTVSYVARKAGVPLRCKGKSPLHKGDIADRYPEAVYDYVNTKMLVAAIATKHNLHASTIRAAVKASGFPLRHKWCNPKKRSL